jgi:hypothetical protein
MASQRSRKPSGFEHGWLRESSLLIVKPEKTVLTCTGVAE